jgi:hypothetical protein
LLREEVREFRSEGIEVITGCGVGYGVKDGGVEYDGTVD